MVALQVETADCIKNIDEIAATPGLDILFLGQNDLCMSMGLFEREYVFPQMYTSKELTEATDKLNAAAKKNNKILGLFLFGTDRVKEFLDKGYTFIAIGNDLHHCLTQTMAHVDKLEEIAGGKWAPQGMIDVITGEPKAKKAKTPELLLAHLWTVFFFFFRPFFFFLYPLLTLCCGRVDSSSITFSVESEAIPNSFNFFGTDIKG